MNIFTHIQKLESLNFAEVGTININSDNLIFFNILNPDFDIPKDAPSVYAWVENDTVMYIGKAGKGIKKRLKEHQRGWNGGSTTGIKKAEFIREAINQCNNSITIYGRRCEETDCFGIKINNIDTEERALIKIFDPEWNIEGRR